MEPQQMQLPGPHFTVTAPGESFTFLNPVNGITHTLTVQEIEQNTLPENRFNSKRWVYPTHFTAMSYTLSPEPADQITLYDCEESDKPVELAQDNDSFQPAARSACAISIIGGADGPAAMVFETNTPWKLYTVCSALHFKPLPGPVEWRMVFHARQFDHGSFLLIEN